MLKNILQFEPNLPSRRLNAILKVFDDILFNLKLLIGTIFTENKICIDKLPSYLTQLKKIMVSTVLIINREVSDSENVSGFNTIVKCLVLFIFWPINFYRSRENLIYITLLTENVNSRGQGAGGVFINCRAVT